MEYTCVVGEDGGVAFGLSGYFFSRPEICCAAQYLPTCVRLFFEIVRIMTHGFEI